MSTDDDRHTDGQTYGRRSIDLLLPVSLLGPASSLSSSTQTSKIHSCLLAYYMVQWLMAFTAVYITRVGDKFTGLVRGRLVSLPHQGHVFVVSIDPLPESRYMLSTWQDRSQLNKSSEAAGKGALEREETVSHHAREMLLPSPPAGFNPADTSYEPLAPVDLVYEDMDQLPEPFPVELPVDDRCTS